MNFSFHRRNVCYVSLVLVALTVLAATTCFETPLSSKLKVEFGALIWAEILLGLTGLDLLNKNDDELPYSLSTGVMASFYLLFTLAMAACVPSAMSTAWFVFTHFCGFSIILLFSIFVSMAERATVETVAADQVVFDFRSDLFSKYEAFRQCAIKAFPGETALLNDAERLSERLRVAASTRPGLEDMDYELAQAVKQVGEAVESGDVQVFQQALSALSERHRARELRARHLR